MAWNEKDLNEAAYTVARVGATADYITPAGAILSSVARAGRGHTFSLKHYRACKGGWNARDIESDLKALGINFWATNYNPWNDTYSITVDKVQAERVLNFFDRAEIAIENDTRAGVQSALPEPARRQAVAGLSAGQTQELFDDVNRYWAEQMGMS
jgi:hypothetical protein